MPKIIIIPKDGALQVSMGDEEFTYRRLRYPTKSVPIPCMDTIVKGSYNQYFDMEHPTNTTLLRENKALLHAHVYTTGLYNHLIVTDVKDEQEYDFNVVQLKAPSKIAFENYTEIANNGCAIVSDHGVQTHYIEVGDNEIHIVPIDEDDAKLSTIYINYVKSKITIECEKPQCKMRFYIPAAVFLATRMVSYNHLYDLYNTKSVQQIDADFSSMVAALKSGVELDRDKVIYLTSARYSYFKRFCKAIDSLLSLPKGKEYIDIIDRLSNCSFEELNGSSHWLYPIADQYITDCIKQIQMKEIQSKKKEESIF